MAISSELMEILNKAGASGIIGILNNGKELNQEELLSILNALAKEINNIKREIDK